MEVGMMLCAAVIVVCIVMNKFFNRFGIPAILIFMCVGMLFGSEGILKIPFDDYTEAERICSTALVFIMFYGGFGTSFKEARPVLPKALAMSTFGVVITAGITGAFCYYILGTNLQESMLVGAVISSTDAASVFSILRSQKLGLKEGTASLLEIESGSNDPFAYMLTMIVLGWMGGGNLNIPFMLIKQIGLGAVFGIGLGFFSVALIRRTAFEIEDFDKILLIAVVLIAYAGAVLLGGNGYLSVYLLGIIIGNARFEKKVALVHFFDGINNISQILIFFLLGLLVFPSRLVPMLGTAVLVFIGLTFIARPLATAVLLIPLRSSWRQQVLVAFSGLRGAASIVFAIMAATSAAYGEENVFHIVFCIALISVLFQGLLLPAVAKKLDMVDSGQNVMRTFSGYQEEMQMQLIQIKLKRGHRYIGHKISDLKLDNMLAVMIERGQESIVPQGNIVLEENDILVLSGESYHGETPLDEISVGAEDPRIGRCVKELSGLDDALIVLIKRSDGTTVIPNGDTKIKRGDTLVVNTSS